LTGAEYKKGKSQSLHINSLKEDGFARFMDIVKIGYGKYLVQEIYETPLEIQNRKQSGNAAVYFQFIELIILKYLSKKYDNKEVVFSRRKLWLLLGMINEKYRRIDKYELIKISKNIVTEEDIDNFYMRCNSKLNRILKTALENLSKRKLINYEERTIICVNNNGRYEHIIADIDERKLILDIEFETLQEFNCPDIDAVVYRKLTQKYYNRIKGIIKEEYNWEYYYKAYSIVFNHVNIQKTIPRIERTFDEAISELNTNIVNALNKEARTTYKREIKKYNDMLEDMKYEPVPLFIFNNTHKPHDNYIIAQEILANELVNINKEDSVDCMYDMTLIQTDIDDDIELDNIFNKE